MNERNTWLFAVYDGRPTDFHRNPYNIKWEFVAGDGILAISELQHTLTIYNLPGTYKIGIFSHNNIVEETIPVEYPDSLGDNVFGTYVYADQKIWQWAEKNIGVFLQAGYSPSKTSVYNLYFGTGINVIRFTGNAKNDVIGLAVAHAKFSGHLGSETVIELTWKKQIHENIFIQPDLQYIILPSYMKGNLDNCLAGIIRVGFSF